MGGAVTATSGGEQQALSCRVETLFPIWSLKKRRLLSSIK
jgi:hypothetical protein